MLLAIIPYMLLLVPAAASSNITSNCRDFLIPVNVTAQQYELDISIKNNWDLNDYIFNLTRRDTLTAFQPIVGNHSVTNLYNISATFCTPSNPTERSSTILLLTHGSRFDGSYWNPAFNGSDKYNFVKHLLDEGYSAFYYDRLGNGRSSRPDPISEVQTEPQVQILTTLTKMLRQSNSPYTLGVKAQRIVHMAHSFGSSVTTAALISNPDPRFSDGLILTGFSGVNDWFELLTAGAAGRVAALSRPKIFSDLPPGYIAPVDVFALAYGGFKSPFFDHGVANVLFQTESPYAIGELQTAMTVASNLSEIVVPVQVVQGKYDLPSCGGNCDGILNTTATLFPSSPKVVINGSFNAGHVLNYHYVAKESFVAITDFLSEIF